MSFSGKVVVISGSSFGIGRGIALAFGREGASVTIHGRSVKGLEECEKFLNDNGIPLERIHKVQGPAETEETQHKLIDGTVERFGRLDILVNNAGCYHKDGLECELELLENFDYVFNLNVRTPVALIQLATPHLAKTKGNVINISSASVEARTSQIMFYVASKAALNSLTESYATTLVKQGIRVNAVSPGIIGDTKILKKSQIPEAQMVAYLYFNYVSDYITPMKRPGLSKEVAEVVLFLASPSASFVTGSNYCVDGGASSSMPSIDPADYPCHLVPTELLERELTKRLINNNEKENC
ncbi:3-oxoacyl-[acyl-carrier-protein] reductase FabG-like [Aphelenchoides besseyi]|nr:3-oxoacyl-[acyl-carrier-protein] reductase FabG-like [Aphelenchoides besseyi]